MIYRNSFLAVLVFFIGHLAIRCTNHSINHGTHDPSFRLDLTAPINKWDEAIALGNGLTGGLLWGEGNEIHLSLDRGDLWDLRPHPGFTASGFTYETVKRMVGADQTDSLNKRYAKVSDFPTKLPGCRLVLTLPDNLKAESFHLDMKRGLGSVNLGDQTIECFFNAVKPVALIKISGKLKDFQLVANPTVTALGNEPACIEKDQTGTWLIQNAALGFRYVFVVRVKKIKNFTLLALSTATNKEDNDPYTLAKKNAEEALYKGFARLFREHVKWWANFWSKSSVNIPDPKIQQHYNLVQYYYGAASRPGAPPIPLQGVWTADEGKLPPWHGDYHNDLNTQLTYWAYLTSNRLDQGLSFLDFMWSLKPVHEKFAHDFYNTNGIIVPGVMALDGKPMGAWYQYSLSPTMGAWVAQTFYLHWLFTMDSKFLKERAYPYCAGIAKALNGLLKPDEKGKLKLPLSSSPEIHNNSQQAWLTPNSNFDLALIRWIFEANSEMSEVLGLKSDTRRWQDLLLEMDDLAVEGNDGTLLVSPDEALKESHRHFSHLIAIYPLGILHFEGSDKDRKIIKSSLEQIDEFGTKYWCGYSFSWMACLRAHVGQADQALQNLKDYLDCTLRSGFHVNGPQTRNYLSSYKMRAFTLEGNFAASQAVHEMLLKSRGGMIRIFPAIPNDWKDVSFKQLRAEGGFLVDARRENGKTREVKIFATTDQPLCVENPFGKEEFKSNRSPGKKDEGYLRYTMKKGEILRFKLAEK